MLHLQERFSTTDVQMLHPIDDVFSVPIAKIAHSFLFNDILSNSGRFRSNKDPNNGVIGFGGTRRNEATHQFHGDKPDDIQQGLEQAFKFLISETDDPLQNALRFYQKFVNVHPFYDANGRIGRLIVSLYLKCFEIQVQWKKFDGNNKFINRLNNCHKRTHDASAFEEYFDHFYRYFKKHTVSIKRISNQERFENK